MVLFFADDCFHQDLFLGKMPFMSVVHLKVSSLIMNMLVKDGNRLQVSFR